MLLYGLVDPSRLEGSLARALQEIGWRVERSDADPGGDDLAWWLRTQSGSRLPSLSLRRWGARERNTALLRAAREKSPAFVLLVNGALVMPDTVADLRREGIPVAVLHPDALLPGNQNHRPEHIPTAREADVCFVWSRSLCARLEREGVRHTEYLPFAWDPEVYPHVGDNGSGGPEVVFIGGWDRERERWLEPVAKRFELRIWGPDYWATRTGRGSPLRACWQGRALRGVEASAAIARASISLNILRSQNLPDGTNMRTFEIPGAGGFQLATRTRGATEILPEGEAAAYFDSVDEMLDRISYYLERPEERRSIARRGHDVATKQRYVHRVRQIISAIPINPECAHAS